MANQSNVSEEATRETMTPNQHDKEPTEVIPSSPTISLKSAPIAEDEDLDMTFDQPSVVTLSPQLQATTSSSQNSSRAEPENAVPKSDSSFTEPQTQGMILQTTEPISGNGVNLSPDITTQLLPQSEADKPTKTIVMSPTTEITQSRVASSAEENKQPGVISSTADTTQPIIVSSPEENKQTGVVSSTSETTQSSVLSSGDENKKAGVASSTAETTQSSVVSSVDENKQAGVVSSTSETTQSSVMSSGDENKQAGVASSTSETTQSSVESSGDESKQAGDVSPSSKNTQFVDLPSVEENTQAGVVSSKAESMQFGVVPSGVENMQPTNTPPKEQMIETKQIPILTEDEHVTQTKSQSLNLQPQYTGTRIPQPIATKTSVGKSTAQETDRPANQSGQSTQPANLKQTIDSKPAANQTTESKPAANQTIESKPAAIQTIESKPAANRTIESNPAANQPASPTNEPGSKRSLKEPSMDKPTKDKSSGQKQSPTSHQCSTESPSKTSPLPGTKKSEKQSDITLFFIPGSYYSQKVLLCLYERGIAFNSRIMNLDAGEHLEPWYVALNPKAEVPMVKIGERYITESEVIINYFGRLPISKGTTLVGDNRTPSGQLIQRFRRLIDGVNVLQLTYGVVHYPHLSKGKLKLPIFEQRLMKACASCKLTTLTDLSEKYPDQRSNYLALSETHAQRYDAFTDAKAVSKEIEHVGEVLLALEEQLAKTKSADPDSEWWLCGSEFTAADISMIVLIDRLYLMGLNYNFFNEELPLVEQYFKRASQRPSYKTLLQLRAKTVNYVPNLILYQTKQALPYIGSATLLGVVLGLALWVYKKAR